MADVISNEALAKAWIEEALKREASVLFECQAGVIAAEAMLREAQKDVNKVGSALEGVIEAFKRRQAWRRARLHLQKCLADAEKLLKEIRAEVFLGESKNG